MLLSFSLSLSLSLSLPLSFSLSLSLSHTSVCNYYFINTYTLYYVHYLLHIASFTQQSLEQY